MSNFVHKKSLGQNFIYDTNLLKAIVGDAEIDKNSNVLEIGVGKATLTKEIAKICKKVVSYEIDKSLQSEISEAMKEYDNSTIHYKDIMQVSTDEINSSFDGEFSIVANLPYYITTPIIFKFLEGDYNVKSLTIMVQKEVAERIVSDTSTKDYGILTVQLNSVADIKICRIVNRKLFIPQPNVDSAIIKIDINRNKYSIKDKKVFDKLVKCAFNNRRKMLKSNIIREFNLSNEIVENLFNDLNLRIDIRGEKLSVLDFVNMSNKLN